MSTVLSAPPPLRYPSARWLLVLALWLGLGFLGTRGLWDHDEGRYVNVALNMLDSGDWLVPRRHHEMEHWTKPPGTYWLIAASAAVFGPSTWSVRLPMALSYLLSVYLAWRIARRLVPGQESHAALVYATLLLPFAASGLVTTDSPLAAAEGLAMACFVEARFGRGFRSGLWLLGMGLAFAAAFLIKGPPGLLPLAAIALLGWLAPMTEARPGRGWHLAALALFAAVAAPWFVAVAARYPGLFEHLVGAEVVERVATDRFDRHGEWYGWAQIYLPTLVLGSLPWTAELWRLARRLPAGWRRWRDPARRREEARWLLLALWILVPLLVFCLARSRLPLYLLPLFLPLALAIAASRAARGAAPPRLAWLGVWVGVLLLLRLAAAHFPTHKDGAAWAEAIRQRVQAPIDEVAFIDDMARYSLHLHLGAEVEKLTLDTRPLPRFNPPADHDFGREWAELARERTLFITKLEQLPEVQAAVAARGGAILPQGAPYQGRVMFLVDPTPRSGASAAPPSPVAHAAMAASGR